LPPAGVGAAAHPDLPEAGWRSTRDDVAYANACRLERRPGVRERIEYLSHQDEELIAEKRRRIEETLWSKHEADLGDLFEAHQIEKDGETITVDRPKRLTELPPEVRKNIEKIAIDSRGRAVPQLYSKLAASQELRKMLEIGRSDERSDVQRLSDAELIAQLTIPTGAILVVIITIFGPVSGAHFNPAVSLVLSHAVTFHGAKLFHTSSCNVQVAWRVQLSPI
jgi:hypothetical protein